jgi:hypothetical protein
LGVGGGAQAGVGVGVFEVELAQAQARVEGALDLARVLDAEQLLAAALAGLGLEGDDGLDLGVLQAGDRRLGRAVG